MIIDRIHQDGGNAGTVAAQGIREDLVAHDGSSFRRDIILCKALPDALGKRLLSVGNAVHTVALAKNLNPVTLAV